MTDEKVIEVLGSYDLILRQRGATEAKRSERHELASVGGDINHLLWMCREIPKFLKEGHREKAMRWLGFLQGAFWAMGLRSVNDMRDDNR